MYGDEFFSGKNRVRYPSMELPEGIKPVNALRSALSKRNPARRIPAGSMYLTDRELEEVDKVAEKYGVSRGTAIKLIIKGLDLG